ncbi:Sialic acid TRAP transporter permease protein SiaT [Sporomusa ovata DSM 2662]|uniref:TRAP-type C4-dicarboxylate transport system, large permease component n=1 Tax=Sporomusa ovata TaxID=2378 RepID=A0A0U1KUE6_9FIRM|nr:TRAP transporter large permease [Sporomusa ovata]EQB26619.1 TRAP transporter DctM subunit [Sporomusa ovata DSM 2662]CQR70709.1 TRAP-type C4-dicarboxylate transport system, large permease component [Sporomusa ovata]
MEALIAVLLLLLLTGVPVAFSLSLAGLAGMYFLAGGVTTFAQVPNIAYKSLDDFVLTAIPLYVLMSQILLSGKVGSDLFEVASKWLRHLPGGLGIATILACAIFAAISGSSVATAVTIGAVAIPEMLSRGYNKQMVLGSVAAGGTLGILIPPSIPMILYGSITGESVGQLFISGVVPGVLLMLLFITLVVFQAREVVPEPAASWAKRLEALRRSFWGLMLPVLVVGGIYAGWFTPTEAAAVGTIYSLIITFFVYKTLTWRDLSSILADSVKTTTMIFAIIIGAMLFGFVLTVLQLPQQMTEFVIALDAGRWIILLLINLVLLFLGCFLETVSIILITLPILYPIIMKLGFDPIWFCVIMVINMELALITPPVGMNLFVIQGISENTRMEEIAKGVLPFALVMVLLMIVLALFPNILIWLPAFLK